MKADGREQVKVCIKQRRMAAMKVKEPCLEMSLQTSEAAGNLSNNNNKKEMAADKSWDSEGWSFCPLLGRRAEQQGWGSLLSLAVFPSLDRPYGFHLFFHCFYPNTNHVK